MESEIITYILEDAATLALIGTRLTVINLPSNPILPAATIRTVSTTEQYGLDGPLGLIQVRLQIDCYGKTYYDAKAVATCIRKVLNGFTGPLFYVDVLSLTRDGETSGYDEYVQLPYVSTDWLILYSE